MTLHRVVSVAADADEDGVTGRPARSIAAMSHAVEGKAVARDYGEGKTDGAPAVKGRGCRIPVGDKAVGWIEALRGGKHGRVPGDDAVSGHHGKFRTVERT